MKLVSSSAKSDTAKSFTCSINNFHDFQAWLQVSVVKALMSKSFNDNASRSGMACTHDGNSSKIADLHLSK